MKTQHRLLSNGRCPVCGKKLMIDKTGSKIWKSSLMIEDERKNIRYLKCPQCGETIVYS